MIKETKKSVIGGFVVGALVLAITGILVFGSGDVFKKTSTYVLFFEDSIKGLTIGAPVLFKGVQIGMVTDIALEADLKKMETRIPVLIETDANHWTILGDEDIQVGDRVKQAIKMGLKASLELQSLVTGKYVIQLDFRPDEPTIFRAFDDKYIEIPTVKAPLTKWAETLQSLPINKLVEKMLSAVSEFDRMIASMNGKAIVSDIHKTLADVQLLINNLDAQIDPLSASYIQLAKRTEQNVSAVSSDISGTVKSYQKLARDLDKEISPIMSEIRMAAESIRGGITTAETTLKSANGLISDDSPVVAELTKTLKELSTAARSIRLLADYLEQHPESLIQGKGAYRR